MTEPRQVSEGCNPAVRKVLLMCAVRPIKSLVDDVSLICLSSPSYLNPPPVPGETEGVAASIKSHLVVCKTFGGMRGIFIKLCRAGFISFILLSFVSANSAMSLDLTELRNKVSEIKVNPRWNLWASGERNNDVSLQLKKKKKSMCMFLKYIVSI